MPRVLFAFLLSCVVVCAGSGGGGSAGSGGGGGTPPAQNVPTITSIAPSSVNAGYPQITITLYGSNFEQSHCGARACDNLAPTTRHHSQQVGI